MGLRPIRDSSVLNCNFSLLILRGQQVTAVRSARRDLAKVVLRRMSLLDPDESSIIALRLFREIHACLNREAAKLFADRDFAMIEGTIICYGLPKRWLCSIDIT